MEARSCASNTWKYEHLYGQLACWCCAQLRAQIVDKYKYLGTVIDNKLGWEDNTDAINSKAQQRLFFLRKLNHFQVDNKILSLFYRSFIESVLAFSLVCWFKNANVKSRNKLSRIVNICSKITGVQQASLSELYDRQVLRKTATILRNPQHPLFDEYEFLPSGRRLRVPRLRTNRAKHSFIPQSITAINSRNK